MAECLGRESACPWPAHGSGKVHGSQSGANVAEMHDTTEEYLETILEIEEEGVTPIRARLVERLGLSAAVSRRRSAA